MPTAETSFLLAYLLGGPDGTKVVDHIDKNIDRLPGLAGLDLVRANVSRYAV